MRYLIIFVLIFYYSDVFSQNGIVKVETKYQDGSNPEYSLKFSGQGFIVDYPVKSKVTNKTVNLKLVLTAAHLVFGGIYENRSDNFKLFEAESNKEIFALGMISDVIHDSAAIVLCTQEAIDFFSEEFNVYGVDLNQLVNSSGQNFMTGGGCVPFGGTGQVSSGVAAFGTYVGPDLVFDSSQSGLEDQAQISQSILLEEKIIMNENKNIKYLIADDSYAIPWIGVDTTNAGYLEVDSKTASSAENLFQIQDLKKIMTSVVDNYSSLSEVPGEYRIPISLDPGYSGSPIMTYDKNSDQFVVSGIYKSSTQSLSTDVYSDLGWASPTELSQGLLNMFLLRYTQSLHRWHTIPQAYLYLNKGNLVREMYYNQFILFEDQGPQSEPDNLNSSGWVRSDTGNTMWARTDTGQVFSPYIKKSKSLVMFSREDLSQEPLLLIALENKNGLKILLPPVIESLLFSSKSDCPSCVNFNGNQPDKVDFLSYKVQSSLINLFWNNLTGLEFPNSEILAKVKSKVFINTVKNQNQNQSQIQVSYTLQTDRIKVDLKWATDSISFYILNNNKYLFVGFDGAWHESEFISALETKTNSGQLVMLETAGVIYYNSELENPYSFRMMIKGQNTQLFASEMP